MQQIDSIINLFRGKVSFAIIIMAVGLFVFPDFCPVEAADIQSVDVRLVPENFSNLSEKASPAVVNIRTVKIIKGGGRVFRRFSRDPFGKDDPMEDFFEKFFGENPQQEFKQRSLGSGFIIDKEGYIVTNNHVIENADKIKVKLNNGREFDAEIIGRDPNTDLALIKIKPARHLPAVKVGNSDALKVGQWVIAIGSPFGLEHTVTAGIVSAKGRVIGSGPYDDFIQTDASINPGNSGGPLINMNGEVIGINTAIVAGGHGIGFAIPINLAKGIINQLKKHGEVTRGWLGVAIQDLNEDLAKYYGVEGKKGVLVVEVFPGDPADEAGIKPKDIIVEVNGKKVETGRDLTRIIANFGVGENVKIKLLRNNRKKTVNVRIAKRKDSKVFARKTQTGQEYELGIRVSKLTPEIARRFNIIEHKGVVVVEVASGSKAESEGVLVGDIVKEINRTRINTVAEYNNTIKKYKNGESIELLIKRMGVGFLVVKLIK
ncbi:MAG: serine protease Do [Desulfobacteraceae bacterium Eth-SRB1]|nr:MAG: serine protease Do [Desulfobacteraceae bacterium Eth-SRB1]